MGNHGLSVPRPWRARTSRLHQRSGGDPASRHPLPYMNETRSCFPHIYDFLTMIGIWLTNLGLPQGSMLPQLQVATYLRPLQTLRGQATNYMGGFIGERSQ